MSTPPFGNMGIPIGTLCLVKGHKKHELAGQTVTTTSAVHWGRWWAVRASDRAEGPYNIQEGWGYIIEGRFPIQIVNGQKCSWIAEPDELIPLAPPGDPDEEKLWGSNPLLIIIDCPELMVDS